MPQLGFGVYKILGDAVAPALATAFAAGYRSIDTAAQYTNEKEVGEAVRASGIPRADLFVTTKVFNDSHGYDQALRAFDESIGQLGLEYVDLYLIHWPVAVKDLYIATWRALEKLVADGRTRAIGVSNFQLPHLRRVLDETGTVPAVNQVELHPWLQQDELRAFHAEHGITTVAWAPLARDRGLFEEPVVLDAAAKHGRTPAQVVLRWHVQSGHAAIPKSANPQRIAANIDVFGFALDAADMAALGALERGIRTGNHPDLRT
ncbi:oxidoreductase [Pseudonocardia sp. CNS-139]|nr:oxidoreductase [Pseudonocardia sp. CNS-139]